MSKSVFTYSKLISVWLLSLSLVANFSFAIDQNIEESDVKAIEHKINESDVGWDEKNIERVLSVYSEGVDWTNAFGDRVQGKKELRSRLKRIFSLDFVMAGKNNYEPPDINFLSENIALARSVNVRTGQKWPDGKPMKDRVINHLRIFKKIDGEWLCVSHMISQAHEKQRS